MLFWMSLYNRPLQKFTTNLFEKGGLMNSNLLKIGGMGIGVGILNLFFCQFFLIVGMFTLFGCESPSFQLLNTSLTNGFVGNILCYSFLVFFTLNEDAVIANGLLLFIYGGYIFVHAFAGDLHVTNRVVRVAFWVGFPNGHRMRH